MEESPEAGTEAEAVEACILLPCSPPLPGLLSSAIQDHLP